MLYVVCGHGNGDSGAIGGSYQEQERVRALAKKIKELGGNEVTIGETTKNWYQSPEMWKTIPGGSKVLELHLDANKLISAKGGHVIILSGIGGADKYDKALADFISTYFKGRSDKLVERNDLANPKRANAQGLNYRLLECCFITCPDDINKFNKNLEEIARGILKCFDIEVTEDTKNETLYRVQVGAFGVKTNAEKLEKELKAKGYDCFITTNA